MPYAREQYMDTTGRLRTRRVRCDNHPDRWGVKVLVYDLPNDQREYEVVCGPCLDAINDYNPVTEECLTYRSIKEP